MGDPLNEPPFDRAPEGFKRVVRTLRRAKECGGTDAELVERAVRRAKPKKGEPRWRAVKRVFGVGSKSSSKLCERFGLDPDEEG